MQKVSYLGNGETTEFTFNFPYFENTDIIVTKNGTTASGYNIVGNSAGLDADIPYTSGKVVFEVAPTVLDTITIARNLPLTRQYDYQPLVKINPTTLNQDMNYMMEVIKDLQDELDDLRTQYSEIADKESATTLLARISAIHNEIIAVSAQITALGDVSQIRTDIANKLNKTLDNIPDDAKHTLVSLCMPDYDHQIVGNATAANTYITCQYDSFVVVWGSDPYTENYLVNIKTPSDNVVCVGQRNDDTNANTETNSFTFLCPKNHSFTCTAEHGFEYRILPLQGSY